MIVAYTAMGRQRLGQNSWIEWYSWTAFEPVIDVVVSSIDWNGTYHVVDRHEPLQQCITAAVCRLRKRWQLLARTIFGQQKVYSG